MFFVILIVIDSLSTYAAYHLSFWNSFGYDSTLQGQYSSLGAIWILLWIVVASLVGNYETKNLKHVTKLIKSTVKSSIIHACFLFLYLFLTPYYYSETFVVVTYLFTALFATTLKVVLLYAYRYVRNLNANTVRFIVVGYTPAGRNIFRYLRRNQDFGYRFMGFFDDTHEGSLVEGKISDIKDYCIEQDVRQIYFALSDRSEILSDLTRFADEHFIHFGLVQEVGGIDYHKLRSHTYDNVPVISYEASRRTAIQPRLYRKAVKLLKQ